MAARITHVIPVFTPGGAELQLATLARAQAQRGAEVLVWCLSADGPLRDEVGEDGVVVVSLRQDGIRHFVRAALEGWRRSGVVHSWMYHGFIMGALLRPFGRAIHVWGVRRTEPFSAGLKHRTRGIVRFGRFLAPHAAHALVFCSETTMRRHVEAGFRAPHMAVTLNSLPPKFLEPRPDRPKGDFTAGCLTRRTYDKGIDVLLDAWAGFLGAGGTGRLLLAGPGIDHDNRELSDMIAAHGVPGSVELLGPFREPRDFHRMLDAYVSPSRTEGFPNVVAEAMATGLPVIATDVGGTTEVLGDAGHVVGNEDARAITEALLGILADPDGARRLGAAARERCATEFTIEACEVAVRRAYLDAGARHID